MKVSNVDVKKAPTKEQIKMLEKAKKRKISFDEDSPELSEEDLAKFRKISDERKLERRKQVITLRVSSSTLTKARALGSGYSGVLSRMLEICLNDPNMIKRCL